MSVNNFFPDHYPWQRILANSSLQIEELTVTENGTYSEDGKAYSPVNVNVSGVEHSITCYALDPETYERTPVDGSVCSTVIDDGQYISTFTEVRTAYAGTVLYVGGFTQDNVTYSPLRYCTENAEIGDFMFNDGNFVMPDENCVVFYIPIE